jgi:hypothetical protein
LTLVGGTEADSYAIGEKLQQLLRCRTQIEVADTRPATVGIRHSDEYACPAIVLALH